MGASQTDSFLPNPTSRYKIVKKIGSGGMGEVFLAEDVENSQLIALKFLYSRLGTSNLELFKKEAELLSNFSHPNLVKIFDFYNEEHLQNGLKSNSFISMEYIEGSPLQELQKKIPAKQCVDLLIQFCRGLHYLHTRNILHRDIKPSNVILTPSNEIKILDFGLSDFLNSDSSLETLGTLSYMPPEAFLGEYNEQSDLFSLGVLFYELISGHLPFQKPLSQIKIVPSAPLNNQAKDFPVFFTDLIDRLIELNPSQRPTSALSIIKYINQHVDSTYEILEEETSQKILQKIPWIDRLEEINSFWTQLENSQKLNTSALVQITGPTGIGRSRFLEELKWQLQLRGFNYYSFPSYTSSDWFSKISEKLHSTPQNNDSKNFFFQCKELIKQLNPTNILVFKDLQDWSESSLKQLQLFLNIAHQAKIFFLIILEYNEDKVSEGLQDLIHSINNHSFTIILNDFTFEVTQRCIQLATLDNPISDVQSREIAQASGGRPLLIIESIRNILCGTAATIPKNLNEICEVRVKSLSEKTQLLLSHLVTHNENIYLSELQDLWKYSSDELSQSYRELESKSIIQKPLLTSGEITLVLPSLKEAYRNALPSTIISEAHRSWMNFLLKKWGEEPQTIPASLLITEHAWGAGEKNIFKAWAWKAAETHTKSNQDIEALKYYDTLENYSETNIEKIYLYAFKAPLLYRLGRFKEALKAYEQWFREINHTHHNESLVQTVKYYLYSGLVYFAWGKYKESRTCLLECIHTGKAHLYPRIQSYHFRAYTLLAALDEKNEDFKNVKVHLKNALTLQVEDPLLLAEAEQRLGAVDQAELNYDEALIHYKNSLHFYQKIQNPQSEAIAHHSIAILYRELGKPLQSLKWMQQALALSQKGGDLLQQGRYQENLAMLELDLTQYGKAIASMEEAQEILNQFGENLDRFFIKIHQATFYIHVGNWNRSQKLIDELLVSTHESTNSTHKIYLLFSQAEQAYMTRRYHDAKFYFESILTELQGKPFSIHTLNANIGIAKTILRVAEHTEIEIFSKKFLVEIPIPKEADFQVLNQLLIFFAQTLNKTSSELELLSILKSIKTLELPELRIDYYLITALGLKQRKLNILALQIWKAAEFELKEIYQHLPEELKMDFQKNRNLNSLEQELNDLLPQKTSLPSSPIHNQKTKASTGSISEAKFLRYSEINHQLSQKIVLSEILERVMDAAIEITHAERGFLLLMPNSDKSEDKISDYHVKTARHFDQRSLKENEFQYSISAVEEAIKLGTYLLTDNAQYDPRLKNKQSVNQLNLKSILVVPLRLDGKTMGAIYLDHRYQPECFSEEDVVLLNAFAGQATLAIQKSQMIDELKTAKTQLEETVDTQAKHIQTLNTELSQARDQLRYGYEEIVGQSPGIMKVFHLLDRVTETTIPVWVCGESGTGKELIAHSLHHNSSRKEKPFITENVSAIPETLLESELFGHAKGAFTHATHDRIGLFEQANGGTLFLDEIADMSLGMQAKVLRVLQEGEIRPVGSNKKVKVDVRLVTASNQDLHQLVHEKKFRQDLFFRINGLTIKLPPLRERKEDIPILIDYLIKKISRNFNLKTSEVGPEALKIFLKYEWPGNIRELEGTLRNALLFANGQPITPELLMGNENLFKMSHSTLKQTTTKTKGENETHSPEDISEKQMILDSLMRLEMDKKAVAEDLGISLKTLYTHMERHKIPKNKTLLFKFLGMKNLGAKK